MKTLSADRDLSTSEQPNPYGKERRLLQPSLCVLYLCVVVGCDSRPPAADASVGIRATWSLSPVTVDGRLDDPAWNYAPVYALSLARDRQSQNETLAQQGRIQVAHDQENLYVAVQFDDNDVVARGDRDQLHHYQLGDVAEVFLKPSNAPWYWKMYVTPNSHKTVFFFIDGDAWRSAETFEEHDVGLRVAAQIQGTLNQSQDRDKGWTAEMAISKAKLTEMGVPFDPEYPWTILVGRYNYSRYLADRELSMCPALPSTNYHLTNQYAPLLLDAAEPIP